MTGTPSPGPDLDALVRRATGARVVGTTPLAAGLGTRRFLRLHLDGPPGTLIARIEAPEDPAGRPAGAAPEPPLEPVRAALEAAGLPVPRSWGRDDAAGVDLLEDLGDRHLEDAVREADASQRRALYGRVVALVPRLQRVEDPGARAAFRRRLDAATLAYKGELFAAWSLPAALGRPARPEERRAVAEAFAALAEALEGAPMRLAHRDLQSRNVMVVPRPDGPARVALVDLQGAWLAPPEYDLVCLLRDSYVELPDEEVQAHLDAVRPELPDAPDAATMRRRFDLLTLARKGKDHARFLYAAATRGERDMLGHVPATVRALRGAAARLGGADPRLDPLLAWIAALPERPGAGDAPCGG